MPTKLQTPKARHRKRKIDWRGIEADYRAGILSLREIAARHGCTEGAIRKRAKRDGWTRAELKAHIIERSRAALCIPGPGTQDGTQSGTQSGTQREEGAEARDEQIVDEAARTQIEVVFCRSSPSPRNTGATPRRTGTGPSTTAGRTDCAPRSTRS